MVKISQLRQISYRLGIRLRKPTKKSQLQQRTTTNAIQSLAAEPVKPQRPLLRQLLLRLAPALDKLKHTHAHFVSHQWDTHQVKKLFKQVLKK